ncbi:hypothetical protein ACFYXM_12720 [Streptomyces sp. NPDC002476]
MTEAATVVLAAAEYHSLAAALLCRQALTRAPTRENIRPAHALTKGHAT